MLFYPWKIESVDLIAGSKSYEDNYKKKQKQIEVVHKEYEQYNDVLEEAIENAEVHERGDENINDDEEINTVSNMDKYAFLYPDRHDIFKKLWHWTRFTRETFKRKSKPTCEKYETKVNCSGVHITDDEYIQHMRTLNKNNMNCDYMLCTN